MKRDTYDRTVCAETNRNAEMFVNVSVFSGVLERNVELTFINLIYMLV